MKKNAIALLIILILLALFTYLSASIPIDSDLAEKKANLSLSKITIPAKAYIVTFEDSDISSIRSKENIEKMFEKANQIWLPANIEFPPENIYFITLNDTFVFYNPNVLAAYFRNSNYYEPSKVNVYFIKSIGGPNGRAYGSNIVAVADKTTVYEYRTLAHEFGHLLGLPHTREPSKLMASGANGFELLPEEIKTARNNAQYLNFQN